MTRTTHQLETTFGTVQVQESGLSHKDAPTLLFVHGALVDGSLWDAVLPHVEDHFRCLVPTLPLGSQVPALNEDAPLAGDGMPRLLLEIAERLGAHRPTLVGNDSGGGISQITAARFPDRVSAVVLTNCDALEVFPPFAYEYILWLARRPLLCGLAAKIFKWFPALGVHMPAGYGALSPTVTSQQVTRWITPLATDAGVRRDVAKIFRSLGPADTLDAAERLADNDLPVHIVWGERDPYFKLSLAKRLQARIGATLDIVPGARCYVMLDEPELLARTIIARVGSSVQAMAPRAA